MGDNNESGNSGRRSFFSGEGGGRWSSLIILVLIVAAYLLYSTVFANNQNCGGAQAKLRIEGTTAPAEYFSGNSAWTEDTANINASMQSFFEKTGIVPYLYDISNEDPHTAEELQKIADDYYKEHFSDETHFLMVFQAGSDSVAAYHAGTDTLSILDEKGITTFDKILKDTFNGKTYSGSDVLTYTYITASEQLMAPAGNNLTFILIIVVVLVLYSGYNFVRNKNKGSSGGDDSSEGGSSFRRTFL